MTIKIAKMALAVLALIAFPGCNNGLKSERETLRPPPQPSGPSCLVKNFSREKISALVNDVRSLENEEILGMDLPNRTGYLAMALLQAGVSQKDLQTSFANGKFAALATWLDPDTQEVDLDKFLNCEENH